MQRNALRLFDRYTIGDGNRPLVIAEAGVNHFGDVDEGLRLIDLALEGGADVVKFQHYSVNELIHPTNNEWRARLLEKQLRIQDIERFRKYASDVGIPFMCTAHDEKSLWELKTHIDPEVYKIGSGERLNLHFIRTTAEIGRPTLISTGMHSHADIQNTLTHLEGLLNNIGLFHCVTAYPTRLGETALNSIIEIKQYFHGPVGWSDHTDGVDACVAAVALGANMIEKHITIRKNVKNAQDWKVSSTSSELRHLTSVVHDIWNATHAGQIKPLPDERAGSEWALKRPYYATSIPEGEVLKIEHLRMLRCGKGNLDGRSVLQYLGKRLKSRVMEYEPVTSEHFI